MGTKEIVIGIEKRFANIKTTKKVGKFLKEKSGKWSGKVHIKSSKYNQDENNNYYTFTIETELPLKNAAEYVRTMLEKVVKSMKIKPFISDSKELDTESNIMRFTQFKSKYIDKIES